MTSLLEFLEDPRPESEKGRVFVIRGPPSFLVHIPPRRKPVVVPVLEKSSEENKESEHP